MKLALGTVQFGKNYGIANCKGQADINDVKKILSYGYSIGMDVLDTAAAYGESESVLGSVGVENWKVITKIQPLPSDADDVAAWIFNQVESSMKRLGVSKLGGLLLHRPEDIIGPKGREYISALDSLKDLGKVDSIGYSVYSPAILEELCKKRWPEIVQAPFNVFDQRISSSGWLDRLVQRGTLVHARSVFLQGLLLMNKDKIPSYFKRWSSHIERWHQIVAEAKISPLEAALGYANSVLGFDRIVVGVDNVEQLQEMAGTMELIPRINAQLQKLCCDDNELIEPFRWKV